MIRLLTFCTLFLMGHCFSFAQEEALGQMMVVNDTQLYVETAGEGEPVVFIHGLSLDTRMWDEQWVAFARYFKVIRYDVRGFGQSARARDPHNPVDDLKALLDALKITKVSLVGLSMGGNIALRFAALYPDRVHKLVAVDANFDGFTGYTPELNALFGKVIGKASQRGWQGDALQTWLKSPLLRLYSADDLAIINLNLIVGDYHGDHFINTRIMPQYGTPPTADLLSKIKVSTLVVVGEKDEESIRKAATQLASQIPNVQKKIIGGAGHLSNIDKPK
nr:alpha/beta hydrolase [Spirosomataceae bacterium]